MRILIDVMSGDNAPGEILHGAVLSAEEYPALEIAVVGNEEVIRETAESAGLSLDGITVIPVSRMSFGIGTGGTTGSKGISFTGGNGAGVKVEPVGFFVIKDGTCRMISVSSNPLSTMDRVVEMMPDVLDRIDNIVNKKNKE